MNTPTPGRSPRPRESRRADVRKQFARVFAELCEHGLLLETDPRLPNVCALVAGEPVRGSWWAHPRSHDIFRVNCGLADHPDVLVAKLVSGKVTFVHRSLWPAMFAAGQAREPSEMKRLSLGARRLLAQVDKNPIEVDRSVAKAASELEKSLSIYSEQFHTAGGAHARRLESWDHWAKRKGFAAAPMTSSQARRKLEEALEMLNRRFQGRGRLPWQS